MMTYPKAGNLTTAGPRMWLTLLLVVGCSPGRANLSEELVRRDAESRQQWLSVHKDLQTERTEIGRQRDQLEEDRRTWAARERSDPIIAAAINATGLLIGCLLPLILIAVLLWPRKTDPSGDHDAVWEILVEDLVSKQCLLDDKANEAKRLENHP